MSYESEVLADTPVAYWRLDEVGADNNGDTFFDLSGNDLHLTETYSGSTQARGLASPIETDSNSREFRCIGSLTGSGTQSSLSRVSDTLLQISGDVTLEAWIRPEVGLPSTLGIDAYAIAKTHAFNAAAYGIAFRTNLSPTQGHIVGVLTDSGNNTWRVFSGISFENNDDYYDRSRHVVVRRVGNVLDIYIDGEFKAQTLITSGLPTKVSSGAFVVQPGSSTQQNRYDEVVVYDHILTSSRIIAHFEAAFNALFLTGRSNVISTATLDSSEDEVPVSYPFRHNWNEVLTERITFATNISGSRNGDEEGVGIRVKPRRELELNVLLRDDYERRKLRARLWRNQDRHWFAPVLQDIEQVTVAVSSGSTVIPVVTSYKDYEVDSYIGIRQRRDDGRIIKSEEIRIVAVNVDSVEVETPLVNSYDAYTSFVYPVRRGILEDSISVTGHTDSVEEIPLTLALLAEDETVTPNRIVPWTPTLMRLSFEVFDPAEWQANNWDDQKEYSIDRARELIDYQSGVFSVASDTDGAAEVFSYRMLLQGREQIARLLGWFYARTGSLNYLWVPSMQRDVEVLGVSGNVLLIEGTEFADNYADTEARRDLAFVYNDNSMVLRRVLRSDGLSPNESLELDDEVPTLVNLCSVSLLKFCRLDGDALEIAWVTNEVAQVAWAFREMLVSPEGYGTHSLSPSHSPSPSLSLSSSVSPSVSPSGSQSPSVSPSTSPSTSQSPSSSTSPSASPSASRSPSQSASPSLSPSESASPSASTSPSSSASPST